MPLPSPPPLPHALRLAGNVDELVVVTLLVAVAGRVEVPAVSSPTDLQVALSTLGATPASRVLGFELLWSPQVRRRAGSFNSARVCAGCFLSSMVWIS